MITTLDDTQCIYKNKNSTIYRQKADDNEGTVLIKTISTVIPTVQQLSYLKNEYEILKDVDITGVRKVLDFTSLDNQPLLILENVEGETFTQFFEQQTLDIPTFLKVAISLSQTIGEIHQQQIIHRDISSNNIIINPTTLQTTVIDFGIASKVNIKISHLENLEVLHGTLHYISPEQTGRMNRVIDTRTDLYSLGVSFYQALTGKLPFEGQNALELVHSHIAKSPIPPYQVPPHKIPQALSDIVMCLLAKNAEDRYQSAFGLKYDLEQCLAQWQQHQDIQDLVLRTKDHSGSFRLVEKLYGRNEELETIISAFERITHGGIELFLIGGYSGIGKSALVNEIHQPIAKKHGIFVKGKYSQLQRDIPYYAITQAFQELCDYLLTLDEQTLSVWQKLIQKSVGNNGQVLIELIPSLELVIGKQPEVEQVDALEAQNRFKLVVQDFIKAISTADHPLVLFLDDLQWADSASLNLIQLLMTDETNQYFLIIGAYRDNEVDATHPFMLTVEELKKKDTPIKNVLLQNLTKETVEEIIVDALDCKNRQDVSELTHLIFEKTMGNAFFSTQLLINIYEQGFLEFDFTKKKWIWDIEQISALNITDNVVDLMSQKIGNLSPETQRTLQLAACLGNYFDLKSLAIIQQIAMYDCVTMLLEAVNAGLINPLDDNYKFYQQKIETDNLHKLQVNFKFVHDRVLQAAYYLLAESKRQQVHLQIGRILLDTLSQEKLETKLFDVLNHFKEVQELITDPDEKQKLARMNFRAGKQAKKSTAYNSANDYFDMTIQLIDDLNKEPKFTFEIYKEKGESEYLSGNFETAEKSLTSALEYAHSKLEKAEVYAIKIAQLSGQGEYVKAVNISQKALQLFGVEVPDLDNQEAIDAMTMQELTAYQQAMEGKEIRYLFDLPLMENQEMAISTRILTLSLDCAIISVPQVLAFYIVKMLNLSLTHGLSKFSSIGVCWYGIVLASQKRYNEAYEYAMLAKDLLDNKIPNKRISAKFFVVFGHMYMLKESFEACKKYQFDAYKAGLELGDFSYAGYGSAIGLRYIYHSSLNEGYKKSEELSAFFKKANNLPMLLIVDMYMGFIKNFKGTTKAIDSFDYDHFTEHNFKEVFREAGASLIAIYKRYKILSLCFFEQFEHPDIDSLLSETELWVKAFGSLDIFFATDYCLASGITANRLYHLKGEAATIDYLSILDKCIEELKFLNDVYEENFGHYYWLLMAEKEYNAQNYWEVTNCYEKAIKLAERNNHIQNAALGSELFAKFWLSKGKEQPAGFYFKKARYLYNLLGADAKVKILEKNFPKYISKTYNEEEHPTAVSGTLQRTLTQTMATTPSRGTGNSMLDLESILKASQTLSEEIKINHLIEKILAIAIENTAAEKGYLIQNFSNKLLIKAFGDTTSTQIVEHPYEVGETQDLPLSIINYVSRSHQEMVLDNASADKKYADDDYIRSNQTKSLLCYPVYRNNQVSVIFYLENNLVEGAFTTQRLKVLQTLSSQMAISIENASLYENLEQKVEERTVELNRALKKIMDSINYAEKIQNAILASDKQLSETFNEHFVIYLPKDVVSGDFYWMNRNKNSIVLAVVDCTGHGIPGAFMSMIGNALLNEIVNEQKMSAPSQILSMLDQGVRMALKQKESENQDGMDVCLCHLVYHETNVQVKFSGAKRPLYYISQNELGHLKGTRRSIGGWHAKVDEDVKFTEHSLLLRLGDTLYLSSDGFADTPNDKRRNFTDKKLKSFLMSINHLPMQRQKSKLLDVWNEYKGTNEQRDDTTIVGIKL
ncbi:hypothetical protein BKI52_20945 [marine bacterium AO1-C]|nr:hypothetical protein BKI52_20945 [marine bacterium AO1-C]